MTDLSRRVAPVGRGPPQDRWIIRYDDVTCGLLVSERKRPERCSSVHAKMFDV